MVDIATLGSFPTRLARFQLGGNPSFPNVTIFPIQSPDIDQDGISDSIDNCPVTPNPGQSDVDGDEVGDLCDVCPGVPP